MEDSRAAESRRGYAVIIINENPVDSAEFHKRKGADQDELNIQNAFCTNLGFEWLNQGQHKDLRKSNVFHDDPCVNTATCACLSCKIQAIDHTQSECFMLIISSHGHEVNKKQVIAFSDDKKVSVSKLIDMLSDKKCPSLRGKPRILILQACRSNHDLPEGKRDDHGVHVNVSDATPLERKMEYMTMNDEEINAEDEDEDDADPYGQNETNTNCTNDSSRPDLGINDRASEDTEEIDRRSESNRTNLQNSTTSSDAKSESQNVEDVISSGEESDSDDDDVDFEGSGIPEQFIIVYPSVSGKRAKRNNMHGSWLITEMCKEICKHMEAPEYRMNPEMNFMKILTRTTGSVAKMETKVYMKDSNDKSTLPDEQRSGLKNAVCTIHRLIKPLVFRSLIKPIEPQLDIPAL